MMMSTSDMFSKTTGLAIAALLSASAYAPSSAQEQDRKTGQQQQQSRNSAGTDRQRERTANMILVGELVDTRDVALKGAETGEHRLLKVRPRRGGEEIVVDIGRQEGAIDFGLRKGDRVIAIGKSARINDRPVLFARSIGELYAVLRNGTATEAMERMKRDNEALTSASSGSGETSETIGDAPNHNYDRVVTLFDTDNLSEDDYGVYDEDFVWHTDEDWYARWNAAKVLSWNNTEPSQWDMFGYDDADE